MTIEKLSITIIAFLLYHSPIAIAEKVKDSINKVIKTTFKGDFLLIIFDKAKAKAKIKAITAIKGKINNRSLKISVNYKYFTNNK